MICIWVKIFPLLKNALPACQKILDTLIASLTSESQEAPFPQHASTAFFLQPREYKSWRTTFSCILSFAGYQKKCLLPDSRRTFLIFFPSLSPQYLGFSARRQISLHSPLFALPRHVSCNKSPPRSKAAERAAAQKAKVSWREIKPRLSTCLHFLSWLAMQFASGDKFGLGSCASLLLSQPFLLATTVCLNFLSS